MGTHRRRRRTHSRAPAAAATAVAPEGNRQRTRGTREFSPAIEPRAEPLLRSLLPASLSRLRSSSAALVGGAVVEARSLGCCFWLRQCCRRQCFFSVLAAAALTWAAVLKETTCIVTDAAAVTSKGVVESAAPTWESSSEEVPLGDVLPALPYNALLSPWMWFICLSSFFLVHAFCKQLLLLLRQERAQRTSKFALLLQSRVFPAHGLNRLVSTTHALVALNWGVLVLLESYSAPAGSVEPHSAATASGGAGAAKPAVDAVGGHGVQARLSEATAAPDSSKVPPSGAAAPVCVWGFGEPVTSQERALLLFSLSYFIYDTCYEGFYGNICDCLHHGAAILGLLNVLGSDVGGRDLIAALVVGELSTPLLHLRYCCTQFAKRLAAVAAPSNGAADPTTGAARAAQTTTGGVTASHVRQDQHRGGRQQRHSETGEGHRVAATGDSDKESADLSANVSPASTASTAISGGSLTRNTASRSTSRTVPAALERAACGASTSSAAQLPLGGAAAGPRTGREGHAEARSEMTTMTGAETRPRADGHGARGAVVGADAATPPAVAAARAAAEAVQVAAAGYLQGRRAQAAAAASEVEAVPARDVAGSATAGAEALSPAAATTRRAAHCRSASARRPFPSLPRSVDVAAVRSAEPYDRPRVRNETFVRSGPNVHIPTPDPAATTGAAAILAAALGTAVAAAALGAAVPAAVATTAAIAAASCSFIMFSLALRLSQRGGDPNSMFATSFHIPAGYVYPPSPRSQRHSAYGSAQGEAAGESTAAAPARAAAFAQQQEAAVAAAFLKRSGEKIHSWLDGVEKSFFLIFLIGRAVLAPCVVYACVTCPSTPILVRASGLLILVVSCYWLFLLFRHVHNRRHRRGEEEKKKTSSSTSRATT